MITKVVPIGSIKPYPKNPRVNDKAVDAVAQSLKQCGYRAKIIVDENMVVLAGHTRLKAMKKLGWTDVEVQIESGMTEEQKKKYRLLDNKTNELADWDFTLLREELKTIDFQGFDFGFNADTDSYINSFFDSGITPKNEKPAEAPIPQQVPAPNTLPIPPAMNNPDEGETIPVHYDFCCPCCGYKWNKGDDEQ